MTAQIPGIRYTEQECRAVKDIVYRRLGLDADAVRYIYWQIQVDSYRQINEVSLRCALEAELRGYRFSNEFRTRYPIANGKQIEKALTAKAAAARRLRLALPEPVTVAYGPDSRDLQLALK